MSIYRLKQHILSRLDRIEAAAKNPSSLIKQLSAIGVASAQKAFKEQALGDIPWSERYPGQSPPILNIAGALQDFNAGRKEPKPNRFQDRPALVDEGLRGGLWGSLEAFPSGSAQIAEWGTKLDYGTLHQEGEVMSMPVTLTAKWRINEYLYTNLFTDKEELSRKSVEKKRTITVLVNESDRKEPTQAEIKKEIDSLREKIRKLKGDRIKEDRFLTRNGASDSKAPREDRLSRAAYKKAYKKKNQKRVSPYASSAGVNQKTRSGVKRKDIAPKLAYFLREDVHEFSHKVGERPFLGHTDMSKMDMINAVKEFFRKVQK